MDIEIQTQNQRFNYCARAIICQDEKILIVCVNDAHYFHLPGGHVEIGETSAVAVLREVQEETGIAVAIDKLAVVQEQFYDKKGVANHSIIFYYLAQPKDKIKLENFIHLEQNDTKTTKHDLRWVSREALKHIDLRPELIKDLIIKNEFSTLQHLIG